MREDAELVELAVGGDSAAFSELYERYFDNVYDFLARMVKDREEAADLAQDTFLRAMNSLSSLSKGGSFKSWLFTIARNTALNRLERSSRLQPLEQQSDEGESLELQVIDPDRFSNPEEAAEAKDYAGLVWEAASSLDERQYSALHYSVRLGFDNEELAEVLGVTRNNAYQIVNRTKAALESAIGALVLLRQGRRFCKDLDAALASLAVGEMTPAVKRIIDRHTSRCDTCTERRRKLASPFAIFAGLAFLQPASGVKAAILENVQAGFVQTYGAGAAASSAGMPLGETMGSMSGAGGGSGGSGGNGGASAGAGTEGGDDGILGGKWKRAVLGAGAGFVLFMGSAALSFGPFGDSDVDDAAVEATLPPTILSVLLDPTDTPTATPTEESPTETPVPQQSAVEPTQPPLQAPPTATNTPVPPTATPSLTATATPTATASSTPPPTSTPSNCSITMTVDPGQLNYEDDKSSLPLVIGIDGCDWVVDFELTPTQSWIVPIPDEGTIQPDGEAQIIVRILRSQLAPGQHSGQIFIDSIIGRLTVQVSAEVPSSGRGSFRVP
ncbi:MAG TPA: RNA polymerase sigma factor [Dehalococcoidia bacterium]|nr:RNA polymerase sigma factor [Dehalococcoidia bacterium]